MSNGLLGKAASVANTNTVVYSAPSDIQYATATIKAVNTGGADARVNIAIGMTATPGAADYIEYQLLIKANGGWVEHSCVPISPNEKVVIWSDQATVACCVRGLEQS